jgi:cytochrome c553
MSTSVRFRILAPALAAAFAVGAPLEAPAQRAQPQPEALLKTVAADPQALKAAVQAGASVAEFCNNCHGANGNSKQSDVPNLAGQNALFLLDRVQKYSSGQRGTEFMQKLTRLFSAKDRVDLVLYYANQTPVHQPASRPRLTERGKPVYLELCEGCHGAKGLGDPEVARIGGQQEQYLTVTLQRYRAGDERVDAKIARRMARVVRTLSDAELEAVVAYVSTLR